jgi:endonuclease/exonuclease/phosphatase family metal-dependent hydrolase
MRVMTCNIRTSLAPDGDNDWQHRRDLCLEVIRARAPDVLALQEVSEQQFRDFKSALSSYQSHQMREGAGQNQPVNAIFFRHDIFELRSAAGYWLSRTPHVSGSRDWGSIHVRLANWVQLREQSTRRELRLINTHLDVVSDIARYRQAKVIAADTRSFPNAFPQVLTGDLNADLDSPAVKHLRSAGWVDAWSHVQPEVPSGHTYHAFAGQHYEHVDEGRIDYIFTRGAIEATQVEIVKDSSLTGSYPSDHYFLAADLAFRGD